jgi:PEP-CTERM motif
MKALLGLSALCVTCLLAGAPLARAGSFSATATAGPPTTGTQCGFGDTSAGGSGFTSASTGPISCVYVNPFFGGSISSEASASGSWVTGDFSASAVVAANPVGNSIDATGAVTFYDAGLVTLPSGMDSAPITFGVTGLSGVVGGGPSVPPVGAGGFSSGDIITLNMIAGGSTGTSGTSVACLMDQLISSDCPNGGMGFGLGPGTLAPITLIVHNGDYLQLNVSVESTANVAAYITSMAANAGITVDPLYLTLPDGVMFDSGITDFLSGSPAGPGSSVPEPATLALLATAFAGIGLARRRKLH